MLDVELNSKNGWIALSHSDKDDFYDFNLLYRWSIRGMTYTDTVLLYPKYIDIFVIFDDGGICVADYIEVSCSEALGAVANVYPIFCGPIYKNKI